MYVAFYNLWHVCIHTIPVRCLLMKKGKQRDAQRMRSSGLKDALNCQCLEGLFAAVLTRTEARLCKVWLRESSLVLGSFNPLEVLCQGSVSSELKLVNFCPRCQWRWKMVFKEGTQFLKQELAQQSPVLFSIERVGWDDHTDPSSLCYLSICSSCWADTWREFSIQTVPHTLNWITTSSHENLQPLRLDRGLLLFFFDSWLPLHLPGKALILHSPPPILSL